MNRPVVVTDEKRALLEEFQIIKKLDEKTKANKPIVILFNEKNQDLTFLIGNPSKGIYKTFITL